MTTGDAHGVHRSDETNRLNGWKEISNFLGKGVRTAQRWERTLQMPVHRLGHKGGEIVFAYRDELAHWLRTARFDDEPAEEAGAGPPGADPASKAVPALAIQDDAGGRPVAAPRRTWLWVATVTAFGLLVVVLALLGIGRFPVDSRPARGVAPRQPSSWKVSGNRLQTFDAAGALLWEHAFEFELIGYSVADHLGRDVASTFGSWASR